MSVEILSSKTRCTFQNWNNINIIVSTLIDNDNNNNNHKVVL